MLQNDRQCVNDENAICKSLQPRAFRAHLACFSLGRRAFQQKMALLGGAQGPHVPCWGLRRVHTGPAGGCTGPTWALLGAAQGQHGPCCGLRRAHTGPAAGCTGPTWGISAKQIGAASPVVKRAARGQTRLDETRRDSTRPDKTRRDSTRLDETRRDASLCYIILHYATLCA